MKVVWAHNWFLDYRVSVFRELDKLLNGNLYLIYNKNNIPERVHNKVQSILGDRAIAMENEKIITIGNEKESGDFANKYIKIRYQPGLYSKIKEINPDVLIGEGFFRWGLVNLVASTLNNIPYVMLYERTMHTERNVSKAVYFARKLALNKIDCVCVNGTLSRQYIQSMNVKDSQITEGHMVTDVDLIHEKCSNVNEEEIQQLKIKYKIIGKTYLFIGQLNERKGVYELIDTWLEFIRTKDNAESLSLVLIGTGPLQEKIEKIAKDNNSIKVLGSIDHDSLPVFFKMADIFIMPTLEDNWSMVVPEAMAASLPIMTSIYNGLYYDLVKENNGWVFDPLDSNNFLTSFNNSLVDKNTLSNMGQNSWEIIKNHSPNNAAKALLEACNIAIDERNK